MPELVRDDVARDVRQAERRHAVATDADHALAFAIEGAGERDERRLCEHHVHVSGQLA